MKNVIELYAHLYEQHKVPLSARINDGLREIYLAETPEHIVMKLEITDEKSGEWMIDNAFDATTFEPLPNIYLREVK